MRYNLKWKKMEKILILIAGILVVSCSNDDSENFNPKRLSSIQEKYYDSNNVNYTSCNYIFREGKLNTIQYDQGDKEQYFYNKQGLVSEILYFNADNSKVLRSTSYSYDTQGRIIEKNAKGTITNTGEPYNFKTVFTYLIDRVVVEETYDGNLHKNEILMNSNKEIFKEIRTPDIFFIAFEYLNGNIIKSNTTFSTLQYTETFSYNTSKNDYNYLKYVFGKEWKTNAYLNYNNAYIHLQSENLISEYTSNPRKFENTSDRTAVYKTKYNYDFTTDNQMAKETRIDSRTVEGITENLSKIESIYFYE
jgi:hypothetical protein